MPKTYDHVLVVPTNRPERVEEFYEAWRNAGFSAIVFVYDGPEVPGRLRELDGPGRTPVFFVCWDDVDNLPQRDIFSRRDSGIRSFGFWWAWAQLEAKVIFTLDDDCLPTCEEEPDYFVREHLRNLIKTPTWASTIPGMRVRGLPYKNLGRIDPGFSLGLWCHVPDVDAATALVKGDQVLPLSELERCETRVAPSLQYFPFCGMNFAFTREMAPLAYFPKMGEGTPYGRFDDIWGGLVIQRVCRQIGRAITVGRPFVRHVRASDPFTNLVKEAPGVRDNENMWEVIEAAPLDGSDPATCMAQMAGHLINWTDTRDAFNLYVNNWGRNIDSWLQLFN